MKVEIKPENSCYRWEYDELECGTIFQCGKDYYIRSREGSIRLTDFEDTGKGVCTHFKGNRVVKPCTIEIIEE